MAPRQDLEDVLNRVTDRESFLAFVRALAADRADAVAQERQRPSRPWGPGANGWEHGTIEAFLDAAVRCVEDNAQAGQVELLPSEPSWRAFATFLYIGKSYE